MEKTTDIGIATLQYDEQGNVVTGHFDALINVSTNDGSELINNLLKISHVNKEEEVLTNAQTLMAAWFVGVNEVEIADRTENEVRSEIIKCEKHSNGIPKEVTIKFKLVSL